MDKNKKNSLILVVLIIVIFVVAYFGYDLLSQNAPDNSYTPTIATDVSNSNLNVTPSSNIEDTNKEEITNDLNNEQVEGEIVSASNENEAVVEENEEQIEQSMIMPNLPVNLMNGEQTTFWELAELGKPVVINSFASWCPPCKSEMPHFIELSEVYKDEVTFIFFDSFDGERETEEALKAFAEEYFNDDTIVVIDDLGYISYLFQSNSLPTTILLDKDGVPVNGFQGMISKETLDKAIQELL